MSLLETVRAKVRALRLYFRSGDLFREALADSFRAWWFPFWGNGTFKPRNGTRLLQVPREYWTMLPTACRLLLFGAHPEWRGERVEVALGQYRFVSAPLDKSLYILREIFIDDVYRLRDLNLNGQVVLDVGAHIGDSSVAFAARGASVHAFEPLPMLQPYLRDNVVLNGMADRIKIHPVGLSGRTETVHILAKVSGTAGTATLGRKNGRIGKETVEQEIRLVSALGYLAEQGITHADILKLDCEGCEYELLADNSLLKLLQPHSIILEYHRGGDGLHKFLEANGFVVERPERENQVGYLYAERARTKAQARL